MTSEFDSNKKLISIVIPVYNEEVNVGRMYNATTTIMNHLDAKYDYEIIFTDNHSTDKTFDILSDLSQKDPKVKCLRLSRNFGYQKSILTGYLHAKGDVAIQIDCDLQDPPELIPLFLEKWGDGFQVVYGIRKSRQEGWFINCVRKIFYRMINLLSEDVLPKDAGDFRLIDRKIIDVLKNSEDANPFLRGMIATIGFKQIGIPYDRNLRTKGKSKFKTKDLVGLALDGILNHSIIPLRLATFVGLSVSMVTLILAIIYFMGKLIYGPTWSSGFATTTIFILLSLSLNALFLGVIGEYIGRIYKQLKRRPVTIIEEKLNM